MEKRTFGMELPEGRHPWQVGKSLEWIRNCGYDFCEICLSAFPLIVHGAVNRNYVDYLKPILESSGLETTFHIGTGLDLRDHAAYELHRKVLFSSIDICSQLGAHVLTVHFEQASPRRSEERRFCQAYRDAAAYAGEKKVLLCMENIEVEDYRLVPALIDQINNPNLRMTLDFGHLYLSTGYFGGDYMTAIDEVAPYVSHVHIHDNTGTFEPMRLLDFARYRQMNLNERIAFGQGDIHIPPFWGTLPITESLDRLFSHHFEGRILLECGSDFYEPFYADMLANVKNALKNKAGEDCLEGNENHD